MKDRIARAIRAAYDGCDGPEMSFAMAQAVIDAMPELQGWQPMETAPRDGTVFHSRNADHPNWGANATLRHVHWSSDRETGQRTYTDGGAWITIEDNDGSFCDNSYGAPFAPVAFAADEYNRSVRLEWMPLSGNGQEQDANLAQANDPPTDPRALVERLTGFTPGPWLADQDSREGMEWNWHVYHSADDRVCFLSNMGVDRTSESEANARLIAAAPDLRAALSAALDEIDLLKRSQSDEFGFSGATVGTSAVGHLREMYRPAFDALGPSGRVSLRNFIDARAAVKEADQ